MTTEWEPHELASQHKHAAAAARSRVWAIIGGVIVGIAILMVAFAAGAQWLNAARWDPLGEYPLQLVTAGTPGATPPTHAPTSSQPGATGTAIVTIYLDQNVTTVGVKCVNDDEGVVTVTGVLSWVSDRPSGHIIEVGRGGGPRGPGCVSSTYTNPIPAEVRADIDKLVARGVGESEWHLTGTETPVKPDGTTGLARTWVSTTFRVIHTEAP